MRSTHHLLLGAATAWAVVFATRSPAADPGLPGTSQRIVAAAVRERPLVIYSTTDTASVQPLLEGFAALYPKISVQYRELSSSELHARFIREVAARQRSADLLWSSAMDLQIKLANDGYALEYDSPEARRLPPWAVWRGEAFGTTYEPIAFVYNQRLLMEKEVPQSHLELVSQLQGNLERLRGRVTSYDPERSGVGFLLITEDAHTDPKFWDSARVYGAAGVKLYEHTGQMLDRIQSGESLLGFNMIASYAVTRQKRDGSLGIVYPKDYTLVMSRIALIPKTAVSPNAAKVFLDYLLSVRGQQLLANACIFALRPEVQGSFTVAGLINLVGASLRPIPVNASLIAYVDQSKRNEFLRRWRQAITNSE